MPLRRLEDLNVDEAASYDPTTGQAIVEVDNYVWDPIGLSWVRMTQPGGGAGGGGVAQTQVRSAANAWTDVGYAVGDLNMPVQVQSALPAGGNTIGAVSQAGAPWSVDVSDRAARLLGHVAAIDTAVDVSDRAGRAVGAVSPAAASLWDVSDRVGRLVGVVDTELPAAAALSDVTANPTTPMIGAASMAFDGASWVRLQLMADADGVGTSGSMQGVGAKMRIWNGATWDRLRGDSVAGAFTQRRTRATYEVMTAELTLGTAVAKNRIISFFHPVGVTLAYQILEIWLYFKAKHTVGVGQYKISFSTVESATGTVLTIQPTNRAAAASGASARAATTADGTLIGNPFGGFTSSLTAIAGDVADDAVLLYKAGEGFGEEPITLRASTAEGILVYQDVTGVLTTAPIVAARIKWLEK